MATSVNPINLAYGRGMRSLRAALGMSQGEFADALMPYGIEWAQSTVSLIENGRQALQPPEIEAIVSLVMAEIGMAEEDVRKQLRLHNLRLVGGSGEATLDSPPTRTTKGGYLTTPAEITRLNPATYPDRLAS